MTKEEAVDLCKSGWWKHCTPKQIVDIQLYEPRLICGNFSIFHKAVEEVFGRPVWTHEFANSESLQAEYQGEMPPKTIPEIMDLIPEDKRLLVVV